MNKASFRLKKDWIIETDILGIKNKTLIFPEGQIFEPTESNEYHLIYGGWSESTTNIGGRMILSEDDMRLADHNGTLLFDVIEPKQNVEIVIQEIPEDDDNQVKNWRIQLDVKTTRNKLKEIQRIFEEQIKPLVR